MQSMASEVFFRFFPSYEYGRNEICIFLVVMKYSVESVWACMFLLSSQVAYLCVVCECVHTLWSTVQTAYIWRLQLGERKGFKMDETASFWIPVQLPLQQRCMKGSSLPSNPTFLLLSSPTVSHLVRLFWTVWGELFCWRTDRQNVTSRYIITFQCSVGVERLTKAAMSSRRILAHRF